MKAGMLLVFFVAAIFLQQNVAVYGFNQNRIVNGTTTPDGMFKFLPKLMIFFPGFIINGKMSGTACSSTIISKRHILTAAHCVLKFAPITEKSSAMRDYWSSLIFVAHREIGEMPLKPEDLKFHSASLQTKYFFHPSWYSLQQCEYDMAIIEFPDGTDLGITPVKLAADYVDNENENAIAAGYGIYKWTGQIDPKTGMEIPETPSVMQYGTVPVHPTVIYRQDSGGQAIYHQMPSSLIYTASVDRYGDEGDSGGPLMVYRNNEYYQIGVTSTVVKINSTTILNSYTRVSNICDWISKMTNGEAKCETLPPYDPNHTIAPVPLPNQLPITGPNVVVTDSPDHQSPEPLKTDPSSSAPFTFNILLLFFGIFIFA